MRVFNRGRFSMGVLFIVLGAVFPFTYYPMDTPLRRGWLPGCWLPWVSGKLF